MPICMPIKDMKDTASFAKKVEDAQGPITITRNGYDVFVVMKSEEYEAMQAVLSKIRLLERMVQAESEYRKEQFIDGDEFINSLKEKYGL